MNIFFKIYSKIQLDLDREKGERKRKEKEAMVTNPEKFIIFFFGLNIILSFKFPTRATQKKLIKNTKKKITKKNKILRLKGFQPVKKIKTE